MQIGTHNCNVGTRIILTQPVRWSYLCSPRFADRACNGMCVGVILLQALNKQAIQLPSDGSRMNVDLVVLNYNGRGLLRQCLGSIVEAAAASRHTCRVVVIDNASTDGSVDFLRQQYPDVRVQQCPNRGLCSYNSVLPLLESRVAVLLNNDIALEENAVDPLVEPLLSRGIDAGGRCYMTAPRCRSWAGGEYEGLKTAVGWRRGLVQATSLYDGHQQHTQRPGLTASAGAVMAVDREVFLRLGGFAPLFLPGRLEDLDLAFRAYQQEYVAEYVPESVAFHIGQATFAREFGTAGCDHLALRNTLLFQWKNLRCPTHVLRQTAGYAARLARDAITAGFESRSRRWRFLRAWSEARRQWKAHRKWLPRSLPPLARRMRLERKFFRMFHPRRIDTLSVDHSVACASRDWTGGEGARRHDAKSFACDVAKAGRLTVTDDGPRNRTPSISVAMIVLDEAPRLRALLPQLAWADEIVLTDGGSRDETVAIGKQHGCRITSRRFDNFAAQRNFTLSQCRCDWVLSLDADERLTPALVEEMREKTRGSDFNAYRVRIRSSIFGHPMRFAGTQNDTPIRLVRRDNARWVGHVHEQLEVPGNLGQLDHFLQHTTLPDLSAFLTKMHRYTRLEAERRVAEGVIPIRGSAWREPVREVFRRLIWKHGWLDGPYGWAFCLLSGLSAWVAADRHAKLWRLRGLANFQRVVANNVNVPHAHATSLRTNRVATFGSGAR